MSLWTNISQWLDHKATALTAYGVVALIALAAFFGLEKIAVNNSVALSQLQDARQEHALLSAVDGQDIWQARRKDSEALRSALSQTLWQGDTAGVIAAQLQQTLRRTGQKLGMRNVRVIVDPTPNDDKAIPALNFELSGLLPKDKTIHDMLAELAKDTHFLDVNQASLTFATRRPSLMRISGIAPIKTPPAQEGS